MIHSLAGSALLRVLGAAVLAGTAAVEPRVLWHVRGEGWGTPAAEATTVYFVTKNHEVVAFDIDSGRERWRADTDEPGSETLGFGAVVAGTVVAVGDYNVIAFDRATGALRWRFAPTDGYAPGPYLGVATDGLVLTGSAAGRLYAVQQETGVTRWSVTVSDNGTTTVFAPQANDHVAVAAFTEFSFPNRGGLVAADLKTGTVRWKAWFPPATDRDLATNSAGGPVLHGGVAVASSGDGQIYAFDLETGEIRWSLPRVSDLPPGALLSPERDFRPLAVSGSTLLSGSLTGIVLAFDLSTRQQRWRFHSPQSGSTVFRMTADDDALYLPYFSGELVVIDVESGRERWRVGDWKQGFLWAPLVWKDRVFASATGLGFYAFGRGDREP
jgi:outer membrane protein assembly factor BamB